MSQGRASLSFVSNGLAMELMPWEVGVFSLSQREVEAVPAYVTTICPCSLRESSETDYLSGCIKATSSSYNVDSITGSRA